MKTETITWHQLPADGMPDADITVLAEIRSPDDGDDSTEVWPAFWSGERWVDAVSGFHIATPRVVAWADQPAGTAAC
jgi:hypothetical protein